mmetsp:Transcript_34121/g.39767  ORF Transcript_34121/g.39767 Transcript_34121/m.39767 type:complete len:205 (-) Transcript_34121:99-713(-)
MQKKVQVKVCILGSSGVGKSSLLRRFVTNEFEETEQTTLGAAFQDKNLDYKGTMYKFQIWDTAGQEKYAPLAQMYYRDAKVAILVYDITNKDSYATLKEWYTELMDKGPKDLIICVVGNKCDLEEQEEVDGETARTYARSINALFRLTSAKENKGISELFTKVCEQLEQRESESMRSSQQVPKGNKLVDSKKKNKTDDSSACAC